MENTRISNHWWHFALRGLFGLVFGALAIVMPGLTLMGLAVLFATFLFVDGLMNVVHSIGRGVTNRWSSLVWGVVSLVAGVALYAWPGLGVVTLLAIVATWSIVSGFMAVVSAVQFRKEIEGEWIMGVSGVLSVLFGVVILSAPLAGIVAISWVLGLYAIVFGVAMLSLAYRLHKVDRDSISKLKERSQAPKETKAEEQRKFASA